MKKIADYQGVEILGYGSDLDGVIARGSQVQISTKTATKLRDSRNAKRTKNADACEYIYQSDIRQENCLSPAISMADFFPVDRRAGMASAVQMNMERGTVPVLPQVVCCPTDIPLISPNQGSKCSMFTGFMNLVIGFDTCMFDQMRCAEQGTDLDEEYLPMIIESLTLGANYVALNGDDDANVVGLRNNTHMPTEVLAPPSGTNIAIELRRVVSMMQSRRNQIIDISAGGLRQSYTLFLASNIVMNMANTWITLGGQQFSLLSILTGDCALCANDPSIPKFRIISLDHLNSAWHDSSDLGYIFSNGNGSGFLGDIARWHKPYSLIDLGEQRLGLRTQRYFAARCGSIEFYNLCSCTRLVIPHACSGTTADITNPTIPLW